MLSAASHLCATAAWIRSFGMLNMIGERSQYLECYVHQKMLSSWDSNQFRSGICVHDCIRKLGGFGFVRSWLRWLLSSNSRCKNKPPCQMRLCLRPHLLKFSPTKAMTSLFLVLSECRNTTKILCSVYQQCYTDSDASVAFLVCYADEGVVSLLTCLTATICFDRPNGTGPHCALALALTNRFCECYTLGTGTTIVDSLKVIAFLTPWKRASVHREKSICW